MMNASEALRLASRLVDHTNRFCESVAIAGSVRRGTPEVKDIEIVAIPRYETRTLEGVLFDVSDTINLLHQALEHSELIQWIKPGTSVIEPWPIKPDGKYWRGLIRKGSFDSPADIKLDFFLARRENWGVIYTIRTGSADFSRELVTYAKNHTDYRVADGMLAYKGKPVECPDEETLFQSLNLEWVIPSARGGKQDLRIIQ